MGTQIMRALVARAGKVSIENRPMPEPGYDEVIVRTTAASICSADPAGVDGAFDGVSEPDSAESSADRGVVLGHEAVGIVHSVGPGVTEFSPGDRVTTSAAASCGRCENCQRGFGGHCRDVLWGGYSFGLTRDGSLAEYFTVPFAPFNLVHVPDGVSDADAVFVTDSLATGSSAIEGARLPLGGSALIIGQGHIGLGATAAARISGAALVITVRNRSGGEEVARAMGADIALNHTDHDVRTEVLRLTKGKGVDLAVEASGAVSAFELAVELARTGGEISGIASYTGADGEHLSIPLANWGWGIGDKRIRTSFQRTGSERTARLLRLLERNRIDSSPMYTHEYAFADAVQAFDDMRRGLPGLVKPIIYFG